MSTYSIEPDVAKQAARDYLTILQAGMWPELEREIREAVAAHRGPVPSVFDPLWRHHEHDERRLDQWRDGGGWQLRQAEERAAHLASLLDCEFEAIEPHLVPLLIGCETRRAIVVAALKTVANKARRELAAQRTARRATA